MSNDVKNILMLGLPVAGKTTFLAAFWYFVRNATAEEGLSTSALPADMSYLNTICDLWMRGETQPRTGRNARNKVSIQLRGSRSPDSFELVVPDLSGELFGEQWAQRQWTEDYGNFIKTVNGILLFVHPENIQYSYSIADLNKAEDVLEKEPIEPKDARAGKANDWDPKSAPTEVVLIDLLQFIIRDPCWLSNVRVSVVISAWDLLERRGKTPGVWLQSEMALLYQFLDSNDSTSTNRIFGVSAQGGNFENEKDKKRLLEEADASKRMRTFNHDGSVTNIASPITCL